MDISRCCVKSLLALPVISPTERIKNWKFYYGKFKTLQIGRLSLHGVAYDIGTIKQMKLGMLLDPSKPAVAKYLSKRAEPDTQKEKKKHGRG